MLPEPVLPEPVLLDPIDPVEDPEDDDPLRREREWLEFELLPMLPVELEPPLEDIEPEVAPPIDPLLLVPIEPEPIEPPDMLPAPSVAPVAPAEPDAPAAPVDPAPPPAAPPPPLA